MIAADRPSTPRLLFVVNHPRWFVTHRLALAERARVAGYEVHVATPAGERVSTILERGFPWHEIPLSRSGRNPFGELRTLLGLVRLYRRVRPHLVHHVTMKPVLYGTLAARLTGVPAVVNAIAGLGHIFSSRGLFDRLTRAGLLLMFPAVVRHRRMRMIFQTNEDRAALARGEFLGKRSVVIPGAGVDMDAFIPRGKTAREIPVVIYVGRLLYSKGPGEFVEAAERIRESGIRAEFRMFGDFYPDNPENIPEDVIRGWETRGSLVYGGYSDDVRSVFAGADIMCFPSRYPEGIPKVLIEAAACGLPAVTSDLPGCRDIVVDGTTGYVVPSGNVDALVTALRSLIESPSLRQSMGVAAREHAVRRFSLRHVTEATLQIYGDLLGDMRVSMTERPNAPAEYS